MSAECSWIGGAMCGGVHHERLQASPRVMAAPEVEASDAPWLLAAAILNSIAEDLALTRVAGWWRDHPREMAQRGAAAQRLLGELESEGFTVLCDLVTDGTRGRLDCGLGWLLRLASGKEGQMQKLRKLTGQAVESALRLPHTNEGSSRRRGVDMAGMPPVRINGRFNPEYGRERVRRLAVACLCRDCMEPLPSGTAGPRCEGCRKDATRRQSEYQKRKQEVAA